MIWIKIIFILFLVFLFLLVYALFERIWVKVKLYSISMTKTAFNGYRIVFLSDFHYSSIVSKRYIKKIVRKVNKLKPDIILLGGDYVSYHSRYITPLFQELSQLEAKVYGVIGNHDINVGKRNVLEAMKKANIHSINNQSVWIHKGNEKIKISGVTDLLFDKPEINHVFDDTSDDDYKILVSHNPDYIDEIKDQVDIVLSGHTHGGQVTLFGLYAPYIPSKYNQKYRTGIKYFQRTKLIISNGIGCVGLPFRFFARPQIVVVELNYKK